MIPAQLSDEDARILIAPPANGPRGIDVPEMQARWRAADAATREFWWSEIQNVRQAFGAPPASTPPVRPPPPTAAAEPAPKPRTPFQDWAERGFGSDLIPIVPGDVAEASWRGKTPDDRGKCPARRDDDGAWWPLRNWQRLRPAPAALQTWGSWGANVGLRTRKFPTFDADVDDPAIAQVVEDVIAEHLALFGGTVGVRGRAGSPRFAIPAQIEGPPLAKAKIEFTGPDGRRQKIELLGDGQQVVVEGTHRSGACLEWSERPVAADFPRLGAALAEMILAELERALALAGCTEIARGATGARGEDATPAAQDRPAIPAAEVEAVAARARGALQHLDAAECDYDAWIKVGQALRHDLGERGFAIWDEWSKRDASRLRGPDGQHDGGPRYQGAASLRAHWRTYKCRGAGADGKHARCARLGTVFRMAQGADWQMPDDGPSAEVEFAAAGGDDFADLLGEPSPAPATPEAPHGTGVPKDPHRAVQLFLDQQFTTHGRRTLHYWRGAYYRWTGTHWTQMEHVREAEVEVEKRVADWIVRRSGSPSTRVLGAMLKLLRPEVFLERDAAEDGAWLGEGPPPAPAERLIPLRNGLFDWTTRTLHPHTPDFFNLNARGFAWDPGAEAPLWTQTLGEWFGDDREAMDALQEMIAYAVSGRTDLETLFYLYGPPRSGRTTVADVMTALVGPEHTAEPTLKGLGETFGLDDLPGKRLVLFRDARQGRLDDRPAATEVLLKITGRDPISSNRKNREKWTGRINAAVVIVSNVMARLQDVSGAIATRLLVIKFSRSFLGKEDPTRKTRVLDELPGIFRWSLEGLERLAARGRLVQPESGSDAAGAFARGASPVGEFVEEALEVDAGAYVTEDDLFAAWRWWAEANGHLPGSKAKLVQDVLDYALARQMPVRTKRAGKRTEPRRRGLVGIRIARDGEASGP